MLDLNAQISSAKTEWQVEATRRAVKATDCQIDRLVSEIYDLIEAEIAMVDSKM